MVERERENEKFFLSQDIHVPETIITRVYLPQGKKKLETIPQDLLMADLSIICGYMYFNYVVRKRYFGRVFVVFSQTI